jgi:hypothetical protein
MDDAVLCKVGFEGVGEVFATVVGAKRLESLPGLTFDEHVEFLEAGEGLTFRPEKVDEDLSAVVVDEREDVPVATKGAVRDVEEIGVDEGKHTRSAGGRGGVW